MTTRDEMLLQQLSDSNKECAESEEYAERLKVHIGELQARNDRLTAMVKKFEWSSDDEYRGSICPECGCPTIQGHDPTCELAALLAENGAGNDK